ncbi:carbohydrate esterase family 5 protein, partial [Sphaerobolus stellatus SS14]
DVTVVFARGTLEAAPIGSIVGPPFKVALQTALSGNSVNFIGVTYAADINDSEAGGDATSSKNLAADVTAQASACPKTKLVISTFRDEAHLLPNISLSTQLIHKGSALLSTAVQSRVNAVAMFRDPDKGQAIPGVLNSRSLTIYAIGDIICLGGQITAAHLGHGAVSFFKIMIVKLKLTTIFQNAGQAVSFVVSRI